MTPHLFGPEINKNEKNEKKRKKERPSSDTTF